MVLVVNKSERVYNINGIMLTPLIPAEIPDEFLNNDRVKEIMADGHIEKVDNETTKQADSASSVDKPGTSSVAKSRESVATAKPSNNPPSPSAGNQSKPSTR